MDGPHDYQTVLNCSKPPRTSQEYWRHLKLRRLHISVVVYHKHKEEPSGNQSLSRPLPYWCRKEKKQEVLPEDKPRKLKHCVQTRGFSTQRLQAEQIRPARYKSKNANHSNKESPRRHSWPIIPMTRISSNTTESKRVIRETDYKKLERHDDHSPWRSPFLWLCTRCIVRPLLPCRERKVYTANTSTRRVS